MLEYEWRKVEDIKEGDTVHRWGDDLPVTSIFKENNHYQMYVRDNGVTKLVEAKPGEEYLCQKRKS